MPPPSCNAGCEKEEERRPSILCSFLSSLSLSFPFHSCKSFSVSDSSLLPIRRGMPLSHSERSGKCHSPLRLSYRARKGIKVKLLRSKCANVLRSRTIFLQVSSRTNFYVLSRCVKRRRKPLSLVCRVVSFVPRPAAALCPPDNWRG